MALSDTTQLGMANRFTVTIDNGQYNLGSFAQVEGLNVQWDLVEYRAGDSGNERWYFPGNTHYSVVRLTRAACGDSKTVKEWLSKTSFEWQPQSGQIKLHDSAGKEVMSWELKHMMPLRWSITGFDASASRVATETLELAHRGFLADDTKL